MAEVSTPVDKLKTGMVVSDTVYGPSGRKLIESGIAVTDEMIAMLKNYEVTQVMIFVAEQYKKIELPKAFPQVSSTNAAERFVEENGVRCLKIDSSAAKETHTVTIDRTKKIFAAVKAESFSPDALKQTVNDLVAGVMGNPQAFSNLSILKMKDEYTYAHSVDVAVLAALLGTALGMDKASITILSTAGLLHDVGKLLVPDTILNKPGKYTDPEMAQMKKHSFLGYKILKRENIDERIANCVLEHHEWVNGKGYPFGKTGIHLDDFSRIIAVCDVYNALTTQRTYRDPMAPYAAVKAVITEAGTHLDHEFTKAFQRVVGVYPNGTVVTLSDGTTCRVIDQNPNVPLRPVLALCAAGGGAKDGNIIINLSEQKELFIKDVV
ncbi:MAG: HD-GYP domain-containing protein [Spirochaetes bacterium]|nr:HD-GYP domain-containing protein [Spirochaetota bacterium]